MTQSTSKLILTPIKFFGNREIKANFYIRNKTHDSLIKREIWGENQYKLPNRIEGGGVVVDIGGHIGIFSVLASKLGATKVITYEPVKENFKLLQRNILRNIYLHSNIEAYNLAVTKDGRDIRLSPHANPNNTGGYFVDPEGVIKAKSISIHDVLKDIEHISILKLDCEGSEWEILYNMTRDEFNKIDTIGREYRDWETDRKSTRLNSSHSAKSRMPSSA